MSGEIETRSFHDEMRPHWPKPVFDAVENHVDTAHDADWGEPCEVQDFVNAQYAHRWPVNGPETA